MKRFLVVCLFLRSCFLHQVRKAYRKGSGDFGVNKGIFPYLVISLSACVASECIHVRACACASCALVHQVGRLCLKHFFCIYQAKKDGKAVSLRPKRLFFKRHISYRKTEESRFVCANNTQKPNVSICFLSSISKFEYYRNEKSKLSRFR